MPKGYWIFQVTITDPQRYAAYIGADAAAFEKYGARFLVRGGNARCVEGETRQRHVVIEFDSYERAVACYESPEYQDAVKHRRGAADVDLVIVEGA